MKITDKELYSILKTLADEVEAHRKAINKNIETLRKISKLMHTHHSTAAGIE